MRRPSIATLAVLHALLAVGIIALDVASAHAQDVDAESLEEFDPIAPERLEVDYAQYGVALGGDFVFGTGGLCPTVASAPCIFGSGGGPTIRGGYRPAGPWYVGGAYQFSKLDSSNLYRLGILQQLRGEGRYYIETSTRFTPYVSAAFGGVTYGNEFSAETAGAVLRAGAGVELELSRFALLGLALSYEPMVFAGFTDTAGQRRETDLAHFLSFELVIELRTELDRR